MGKVRSELYPFSVQRDTPSSCDVKMQHHFEKPPSWISWLFHCITTPSKRLKENKTRDEKIMLILFVIWNIKRTSSLRLMKGWYGIILSIGYTCHTMPGKRKHEGKPRKDKTHDNGDQEWKMPSANAKKHYEGKFY